MDVFARGDIMSRSDGDPREDAVAAADTDSNVLHAAHAADVFTITVGAPAGSTAAADSPPTPSSPTSSTSSSSSSYYSSISTPYPIVQSSPSLIDSVRSSARSNKPHPHPYSAHALHSSIPPLPHYRSLPIDLSQHHPLSSLPRQHSLPLPSQSDSHLLDSTLLLPHQSLMSTYPPPPSAPPEPSPQPQLPDTELHSTELHSTELHNAEYDDADTASTAAPRPRSVLDMAIDTASINAAGRAVRRNAISRLSSRWRDIPRNARIFLIFNGIMAVVKIVATVVVLVLDRDMSCPYLEVLLILYVIRTAIGFPFALYSHLHPRVQGAPFTTRDIILERQRTMMEIAGTCLFFLSNYFLFAQAQCRQEAPAVYYMTVFYVILGYVVILIPLILCLAVILCLPLVLRIMRALDLGPIVGTKGATEQMIAAIPIVKYRKPVVVELDGGNGNNEATVDMREESGDRIETCVDTMPSTNPVVSGQSNSTAAPPPASGRPKRRIFGGFRKGKKQSASARPVENLSVAVAVEYLTLADPQDAICAICLCDYEDEEELRKMRCNHYFHKDCVDEWLRLNRNCPLCKRDIDEQAERRDPAAAESSVAAPALAPTSPSIPPLAPFSAPSPTISSSRSAGN
ncbi:hypothetical protein EDD21DRAFT_366986 [Dissophora ornata]|nr:hypothetical protein EDD21DRAFT_366986 [Dissophora ornata]